MHRISGGGSIPSGSRRDLGSAAGALVQIELRAGPPVVKKSARGTTPTRWVARLPLPGKPARLVFGPASEVTQLSVLSRGLAGPIGPPDAHGFELASPCASGLNVEGNAMIGTALAMAASAVAGLIVGLVVAWAKIEQRQRKLDMFAEALEQQAELLDARHSEAPTWQPDTGNIPRYRATPVRALSDRTAFIARVTGRAPVDAPPALSSTDTTSLPELPAANLIARLRAEHADSPLPVRRTGRHRAEPDDSELFEAEPVPETDDDVLSRLIARAFAPEKVSE